MQYRELGRTGWKVSTISFGAWAIGSTWGTAWASGSRIRTPCTCILRSSQH